MKYRKSKYIEERNDKILMEYKIIKFIGEKCQQEVCEILGDRFFISDTAIKKIINNNRKLYNEKTKERINFNNYE